MVNAIENDKDCGLTSFSATVIPCPVLSYSGFPLFFIETSINNKNDCDEATIARRRHLNEKHSFAPSFSSPVSLKFNMEPITFLTIFTHLFSYSFNILLLYLISDTKSGIKTKSYISHLIWVELVLNICQHFSVEIIPNLDEKTRMKDVCIFFMSLQMWTVNTIRYVLTFVMALNRFICNVSPRFNKYFDSESIAFFGFGVWMISFIASWYLLLLGCFPRFDPVNFAMDTDCDNLKWSDFIYKSHYLLVLTLLLNISIVIYAKMRRCGFFAVAVARVSSVAASRRSRNEAVFVIQSFIVFFIMGYDVVYSFFRKSYVEEFKGLSRNMQIMLGWLNIYSANYINFLIYFLFHKANRSLVIHTILCTLKWVKTHKVRPT
uniref:Uncharacterized protein n=2 Tax=Caenorhabditis japonica TaxID=281687 RepID=A0A8R1E2U8_CAEJA